MDLQCSIAIRVTRQSNRPPAYRTQSVFSHPARFYEHNRTTVAASNERSKKKPLLFSIFITHRDRTATIYVYIDFERGTTHKQPYDYAHTCHNPIKYPAFRLLTLGCVVARYCCCCWFAVVLCFITSRTPLPVRFSMSFRMYTHMFVLANHSLFGGALSVSYSLSPLLLPSIGLSTGTK